MVFALQEHELQQGAHLEYDPEYAAIALFSQSHEFSGNTTATLHGLVREGWQAVVLDGSLTISESDVQRGMQLTFRASPEQSDRHVSIEVSQTGVINRRRDESTGEFVNHLLEPVPIIQVPGFREFNLDEHSRTLTVSGRTYESNMVRDDTLTVDMETGRVSKIWGEMRPTPPLRLVDNQSPQ